MKPYDKAVVETIVVRAARYRAEQPPRNPLAVRLMPEEMRAVANYAHEVGASVVTSGSGPREPFHVAGLALVEVRQPPATVESRFLFEE